MKSAFLRWLCGLSSLSLPRDIASQTYSPLTLSLNPPPRPKYKAGTAVEFKKNHDRMGTFGTIRHVEQQGSRYFLTVEHTDGSEIKCEGKHVEQYGGIIVPMTEGRRRRAPQPPSSDSEESDEVSSESTAPFVDSESEPEYEPTPQNSSPTSPAKKR